MSLSRFAVAASAMAAGANGMTCPGSGSFVHASMEVTTVIDASCDDVAAEIGARAGGKNGFVDPHNGGIYALESSSITEIRTSRTANPAKSVGGQKYVDKQVFTLTPAGNMLQPDSQKCKVDACSESQGTSVKDFSTNYCDIRNLYCGSADGCKPVLKDFTSKEVSNKPSIGAGNDFKACTVKPSLVPAVRALAVTSPSKSYTCPGSGSWVRAWIEVTATADASCANVAAEITSRASAQNGWTDPHNGGIYAVESANAAEIRTSRTANPKKSVAGQKYVDKQVFVLTEKDGKCQIDACSESQGFSVGDFSTNYCDITNLYCGSADGCSPVKNDFTSKEDASESSVGAGHDFKMCIVKATADSGSVLV